MAAIKARVAAIKAGVAVTNVLEKIGRWLALLSLPATLQAAVLPEDRVDILYHSFDGGGVTIDGPSVLVRKNIANTVSVYGNYYVDMVSSASIDVEATASPYSEERAEVSAGLDYLHDKTIMSLSYTRSEEDDYEAQTVGFGISQDFFGDLTTVGLGFSLGSDTVKSNADSSFEDQADHRRYSLSLTQILTENLIANLSVETVVDEGYLNNPYRSVRYLDSNSGVGYSYEKELYPRTRNSDAAAIRALYYLPYRASLRAEFRTFSDSWGISADAAELRYTHPFAERWMLELKYRFYDQTQADFYSDLFAFSEATNFRARDKELSSFTTQTLGIGVSYEFRAGFLSMFDKSTVNLYWDHMQFDYDNFRDVTQSGFAPGEEPSYRFDADVIRFFLSFWY